MFVQTLNSPFSEFGLLGQDQRDAGGDIMCLNIFMVFFKNWEKISEKWVKPFKMNIS